MSVLHVLAGYYAVCRLPSDAPIPEWAKGDFCAITRTPHELSVACEQYLIPEGTRCERGWRILQVEGPLEFSTTGILSSIAGPLADAGVSIFAISTFDTDYVLVKEEVLEKAIQALGVAGHRVSQQPGAAG